MTKNTKSASQLVTTGATHIGRANVHGFDKIIQQYPLVMGFHGYRLVSVWIYAPKEQLLNDRRSPLQLIEWYGIKKV